MNAIAWCILVGAGTICIGMVCAANAVCETLSVLIQPPTHTAMTHNEYAWERDVKPHSIDPRTADPYKLSGFRRNPHDVA